MDFSILKELLTGASIGLSPAVAWLTFITSWNQKKQQHDASIRRSLIELKDEIDHIGNWAQSVYTSDSDAEEWTNPFWRVLDFPSSRLSAFNTEYSPSDVGRDLSDALVKHGVSIAAFRKLLNQHKRFVKEGMDRYSKPDPNDPSKFIFKPPADWVSELCRLNKKIHVQGIGDESSNLGLHATWNAAYSELEKMLARPMERRKPNRMWIGHILALILGIVGLIFLIALILELYRQVVC